jgi:hypothetical protein
MVAQAIIYQRRHKFGITNSDAEQIFEYPPWVAHIATMHIPGIIYTVRDRTNLSTLSADMLPSALFILAVMDPKNGSPKGQRKSRVAHCKNSFRRFFLNDLAEAWTSWKPSTHALQH